MKLDELYNELILMLKRGVDPSRLRDELECAIKNVDIPTCGICRNPLSEHRKHTDPCPGS